jgi:hypothetical protein
MLGGRFIRMSHITVDSQASRSTKIDGKKIIEQLGGEALAIVKSAHSWSLEDIVRFLREKTGIEIDLSDKGTEGALQLLREKYDSELKVLALKHHLALLTIQRQLENRGIFEEAPVGTEFPQPQGDPDHLVIHRVVLNANSRMQRRFRISAADFPEILERDEGEKKT